MRPQQVIDLAKTYVVELFAGEGATDIGLEELSFDEKEGVWEVTIGFSRSWDQRFSLRLGAESQTKPPPRTFKVILIRDSDAVVLGIRHWSEAA